MNIDTAKAMARDYAVQCPFRASAMAVRVLLSELKKSEAMTVNLASALRNLYDEQNGPPLSGRESHWQNAFAAATYVLGQYDAGTERLAKGESQ